MLNCDLIANKSNFNYLSTLHLFIRIFHIMLLLKKLIKLINSLVVKRFGNVPTSYLHVKGRSFDNKLPSYDSIYDDLLILFNGHIMLL